MKIVGRKAGGRVSAAEARRLRSIRSKIQQEFPPRRVALPRNGLAATIRAAREAQGKTWYSVAREAGIPNPGTVRDMEQGRDTLMSSFQAVVKALGLEIELVEKN